MAMILGLLLLAAPAPGKAGGWTVIADPARDRAVVGAANYAVAHFPRPTRLARIISARRQIVAGTNYRIRLRTVDRKTCDVVVWHRLDHGRDLTQVTCWR